ncbi:hypothetical protein EVAR_17222_1 [Eumeta japonica]|uniref:Uncharacterized protein n=1 Tax=Eumeta variegata TaxID=151549 RepID=A0A4C1U992_EUMVA|nr:hypothetical protein EVAR_17222_1 [Eumeta japonica]
MGSGLVSVSAANLRKLRPKSGLHLGVLALRSVMFGAVNSIQATKIFCRVHVPNHVVTGLCLQFVLFVAVIDVKYLALRPSPTAEGGQESRVRRKKG